MFPECFQIRISVPLGKRNRFTAAGQRFVRLSGLFKTVSKAVPYVRRPRVYLRGCSETPQVTGQALHPEKLITKFIHDVLRRKLCVTKPFAEARVMGLPIVEHPLS
jgi:hypothetical protein